MQAFRATTANHTVEIIVVCDRDRETFERLQQEDCKVLYQGEGNAISAWNMGLRHATGEYIVFAANDLVPRAGWLDEALRVMRSLPNGSGLVGLNTGDHDTLATHFMVSRGFIKGYLGGVLAIPHYHHCFTDNEVNERARRAGRYAYAEGARIDHRHPSRGKREADECDAYAGQWFAVDQTTFEDRKARGFPDDYEAVI